MKRDIKLKHELWYKIKSKGKRQTLNRTELLKDYKRTCKIKKKYIKNRIVKFENELAASSKNNPKILYAYIKSQQKCKDSVRLLITEKGDEITDTAELAEHLNCYFQSVFVRDGANDTTPIFACRTNHYCNDDVNAVLSYEELISRLEKLEVSKATGVDGVSPVLLKK